MSVRVAHCGPSTDLLAHPPQCGILHTSTNKRLQCRTRHSLPEANTTGVRQCPPVHAPLQASQARGRCCCEGLRLSAPLHAVPVLAYVMLVLAPLVACYVCQPLQLPEILAQNLVGTFAYLPAMVTPAAAVKVVVAEVAPATAVWVVVADAAAVAAAVWVAVAAIAAAAVAAVALVKQQASEAWLALCWHHKCHWMCASEQQPPFPTNPVPLGTAP